MAVAKGKRPSGAKKTASKKEPARKPAAKKKTAANIQSNKAFRNGVLGMGLVVLCLVILLCLITNTKTSALEWIRNEFNGYFGALRFPVLLFLALTGLKIAFGDRFPIRTSAFITAAALLLCIATLLEVFQRDVIEWAIPNKGWQPNYKGYIRYAYDASVAKPTGGGAIGELLGYPLGEMLDIVASALVLFFAIGALAISLVRNLRPDAGATIGGWFSQFSSDYSQWKAERQHQKESSAGASKESSGTLVPIPEELLQKKAAGETQPQPTTWRKMLGTASRIGSFFSPVVTSQVPPNEPTDETPAQRPAPEELAARQTPQIPSQIPAQINAVHTQTPNRVSPQKSFPRSPATRSFTPPQGKRQLYIEDIITSEQYAAGGRSEPPKGQKPHIRAVPSAQDAEPKEFTMPDFLKKRMDQYEADGLYEYEMDGEPAPASELLDDRFDAGGDEPEGMPMADDAPDEPEIAESAFEGEPWETMEPEYDPDLDDDLSRPIRRRRSRMENPLDAQPKLDPATRLDRPDWKPEEPVTVPHGTGFVAETEEYRQPPFSLLIKEDQKSRPDTRLQDAENAQKLEETLASFGVDARVIKVVHGPAITRYELQPAPGVKVSKIVGLTDDIALNMAALGVRIEAPIPGKAAIGIEIANDQIETVHLRDVLESEESISHPSRIAVALGKDIAGKRIIADLARMPHLLIAGATGAGKSVCINTLITSIIYRSNPDEVRLIMIDPKKVELSLYNGIPHLLVPVVTDPKKASGALNWAVMEMDERYRLFAEVGVREISSFNAQRGPETPLMPQIVVIIDELSDLMMTAPSEVEESINRLAQLARACGIHLVIATQRPSVNVITGKVKANIPSRIAFSVASQVDSRTILDAAGAEKLLGKGDMLFLPPSGSKPIRVQGCFISDAEVNRVVEYVKDRNAVDYNQAIIDVLNERGEEEAPDESLSSVVGDALFQQAVEMAVESGQASISMLQRRLRVGYARAGRLVDEMAKRSIIGPADGAKPREVLITREDFEMMFNKKA